MGRDKKQQIQPALIQGWKLLEELYKLFNRHKMFSKLFSYKTVVLKYKVHVPFKTKAASLSKSTIRLH